MSDDPSRVTELDGNEKAVLVERKATCPFIGSVVAQGTLPVRNDSQNPLASIEDLRKLGNIGGGDLGDLLVFFASGNHAFMRGASGKLDRPVPSGLFSLEFPGSQGSHPGHSGILEGDPETPNSGRLSKTDLTRLTDRATDGWIKRSDVGRFIAENMLKDPRARVLGAKTAELIAGDLLKSILAIGPALTGRHRELEEKLTKVMGDDNLAGSAGEFGLLFAFLANRPGAREIEGEPAISVEDVQAMFVDKRLPDGWDTWKKSRIDWVRHTTHLVISAAREYQRRRS